MSTKQVETACEQLSVERNSANGKVAMARVELEHSILMHDLLSAYHEKLSVVLAPTVAETFRGQAVDKVVQKLCSAKELSPKLSSIGELLDEWGATVRVTEAGEQLLGEIDCPFAIDVHPLLSSSNPQCPLATLVVGLARALNPNSRLESSNLTEKGAKFQINHKS